jgi:hypothetical protein
MLDAAIYQNRQSDCTLNNCDETLSAGAAGPDMRQFLNTCIVRRVPFAARDSNDFSDAAVDWMATMRIVNRDLAGPALRTALVETGLWQDVPGDVAAYLDLLYAENRRCNDYLRIQCDAIGSAVAGAGAQVILLKGAVWLYEDGPSRHDRMLRDIDILVDAENLGRAREAIHDLGYRKEPTIRSEDGHIHDAPLVHDDGLASLEIHTELSTRVEFLPGAEVAVSSTAIAPGLRIPSPSDRIVHNAIHGQITNGDYRGGTVNLRDILDIVRIACGRDLDWEKMARDARQRGYFDALSGAIHKAALFAGGPLPPVFAMDKKGQRHAERCGRQRNMPLVDKVMRGIGILGRALAWERDAYALKLGDDRGMSAHIKVNLRRSRRIAEALRRIARGS